MLINFVLLTDVTGCSILIEWTLLFFKGVSTVACYVFLLWVTNWCWLLCLFWNYLCFLFFLITYLTKTKITLFTTVSCFIRILHWFLPTIITKNSCKLIHWICFNSKLFNFLELMVFLAFHCLNLFNSKFFFKWLDKILFMIHSLWRLKFYKLEEFCVFLY